MPLNPNDPILAGRVPLVNERGLLTKAGYYFLLGLRSAEGQIEGDAILAAFGELAPAGASFAQEALLLGDAEVLPRRCCPDTADPMSDVAALIALNRVRRQLQDLAVLVAAVQEASRPASGDSAGETVVQIAQTITADTTISDPGGTVPDGGEVEYQFTQDGTGGWVVDWDTEFKGVDDLTVGRTADFWSVVRFRKLGTGVYARLFATGDIDLS